MATRIILVRHAAAQALRDVPEPEWPLSAEGKSQAQALAAVLAEAGVSHLWSSPFPRAVATLAPFAERAGLNIGLHDDLRERLLAPEWIEDFLTPLRRSFAEPHFKLEGGESAHEAFVRIDRALRDIAARHDGARVAVATHGNVLSLFLRSLSSDDGTGFWDFWRSLRNPDLFEVVHDGAFAWDGERFSPPDATS